MHKNRALRDNHQVQTRYDTGEVGVMEVFSLVTVDTEMVARSSNWGKR